jgi:hypothetical protein
MPPTTTTNYTWYRDIQPIVAANCAGCHVTGGIGPFDLTTYDNFKANAALASAEVGGHVMPPWMPGLDSPAIMGTRRLTDAQIETVQNWVAGGMPEGDASMQPQETPPQNNFTASVQMQVPSPYTPDASLGTDDYHCFVLDPQLTESQAVTAFNITPGDRRVVHHVILYAVSSSQDLQQLQGMGNSYTCFGGSGIDDATMVGGWVPGTQATTFPSGTGIVLSAGTKIVMQVHYNMLTVQHTTDQTTAELQYSPASSVTSAYIFPIYNASFSIPPGAVQTVTQTFGTTNLGLPAGFKMKLWGVLPHMHLHGTDIRVTGQKADGTTYTLIHVPKWDFRWQQLYFFETPMELAVGDSAELSCTFDNTQQNQPVINGVQATPQTLTWGEDTLNEMCLNFFYATVE